MAIHSAGNSQSLSQAAPIPGVAAQSKPSAPSPQPSQGASEAAVQVSQSDQSQAQVPEAGRSQSHLSLDLDGDSALQTHLKALQPYLHLPKGTHLSQPQKEKVLKIFQASQKDGSVKELARTLHQKGELKPLYEGLGTLVNTSAGASAILGIFTLGTSLVVEAKDNLTFKLKDLLTESGVDAEILKQLN